MTHAEMVRGVAIADCLTRLEAAREAYTAAAGELSLLLSPIGKHAAEDAVADILEEPVSSGTDFELN